MQGYPRNVLRLLITLLLMICAGCSSLPDSVNTKSIISAAIKQGWQPQILKTTSFNLQTFFNQHRTINGVLTIYIEGDGHAWLRGYEPSDDPTPLRPIALQLAMQQQVGAVAYLGRPCQFIGVGINPLCDESVWTNARYSEAVIGATNQAIDQLKHHTSAQKIDLVGFSGGAAVSLLVAARRSDVHHIISVAGNVDPQAWVSEFGLSPLSKSLDTVSVIPSISKISQVYFAGGKDQVIPPRLIETFIQRFPTYARPRMIVIPENSHTCCWVEQWQELQLKAMQK